MATWYELNADVQALGTTFDIVRCEYLRQLADRTGRTMVLLYSGWVDLLIHTADTESTAYYLRSYPG